MDAAATKALNWRHDRVRANTKPEYNQRIDQQTVHFLRLYAHADRELIGQRLEELDREWDMDRTLQANAATISLSGFILGKMVSRAWYVLPIAVGAFLLQHAMKGWCLPESVFRRAGIRTRKEIDRERYALKLLRGDFDAYHSGEKPDVERVLQMIDR